MNIAAAIKYLYPTARDVFDFAAEADPATGEAFLRHWNTALGPRPTEAELLAVEVPATKAIRLAAIRAEAARRILAKWPVWVQNNCALGIYPEATAAQCSADIAAVVTASNAAEDAVTAATTVAEVEAVAATWPML